MAEITLPFGRAADGTMVTIDDVVRGLDCECTCPKCHRPLVACKGEVVRPYFRHHVDFCSEARETALHLYAKQLIARERRLALPYDLGEIIDITIEKAVPSGVRPDVLIEYASGETLAVEIWVSHQVDLDKVQRYAQGHQAALEIDLRYYRGVDTADWARLILETAERYWIYPPAAVREQRERERREFIEGLKRKEAEAAAAMRAAAAARVAEEDRLREQKRDDDIRRQALEVEAKAAEERLAIREADRQRALVARAQERIKTAELRAAILARRKRERIPPDLGELVRAHGTYGEITQDAWDRYHADCARYYERVRTGFFYFDEIVQVPSA